MINTLFLNCYIAVEPTFVSVSFSTRKHTSIVARTILSNFCEEQLTQNLPQYLSGLSRALYPTTSLELAVFKFTNISLLNQQQALSGYPHILFQVIRKADSTVLKCYLTTKGQQKQHKKVQKKLASANTVLLYTFRKFEGSNPTLFLGESVCSIL